jgi:hypothetical protein
MNPWEPIEQAVREVLQEKGQEVTDEIVRDVCTVFVAHLMAGKDFRVGVEETIDNILYQTNSYGGLQALIVA